MNIEEEIKNISEILDKHGALDIVAIPSQERNPFCDYYVLATAPNNRAIAAYMETIPDELEERGIPIRQIEGTQNSNWVIIDTYNCLISLFLAEARKNFALEDLLEVHKA